VTTSSYDSFLARKALVSPATGIPEPPALSPKLKEHQRLLTAWALRRGRAAIFADTGLGKGWMILEWARIVCMVTEKPVLVLAPLAVSQQFDREATKLWGEDLDDGGPIGVTIARDASDVESTSGVCVTNYQKLHKFDPSVFGGVALDEASILKSLDGSTRKALIDAFRQTPFKLCATATPSPNDHTELGGQSEFLGVMTHAEMLATFFVHDGGSTQDWRIKGHAREAFWRWVTSWGAIVKMPSDIGCSDDGYELPPLRYHEHVIPATQEDARKTGLLFAQPAETLNEQRAARRGSLDSRVREAVVACSTDMRGDGRAIVWCDLNVESEALAKLINGAEEVTGSQDDDIKEAAIERFVSGQSRVLVSKPTICGYGLNLQFVSTVVFCGVTHSFEQFYQAIRRCWRFGQLNPVDVHIISSELEGNVVANLKEKQRKAEELSSETRHYVAAFIRDSVLASGRQTIPYEAHERIEWPEWLKSGL
jgi:hypothetical protein